MPLAHWNGTYTGDLDWSNVVFLGRFRAAEEERNLELTGYDLGIVAPMVGDDVQLANTAGGGTPFITLSQNYSSGFSQFMSPVLAVDFTPTVPGMINVLSLWQFPGRRSYVGLDPVRWTSKHPRRISNIADTADDEGNPSVAGQRAQLRPMGQVHKCLAFGVWAPEDVLHHADTVSTLLPSPDAVTSFPDSPWPYGPLKPGDYIGPWIFNELRDDLNATIVLCSYSDNGPGTNPGGVFRSAVTSYTESASDNEPTLAGVQASTLALYLAAGTNAPSPTSSGQSIGGTNAGHYSSLRDNNGLGTSGFSALLVGERLDFEEQNWSGCKRTIDYYIGSELPPEDASDPTTQIYSADGRGVVQGVLRRIHTEVDVSGVVTWSFDNLGAPSWGSTGSGLINSTGFNNVSTFVVANYRVAGGFQYTEDTP